MTYSVFGGTLNLTLPPWQPTTRFMSINITCGLTALFRDHLWLPLLDL